jgi:Flp pilus assembly protein TadD
MAFKPATRISLAIMLLGSSAIGAQAGWFSSSKTDAKDEKAAAASAPGTNLETSIQQAQALRLSGNYAEAVKHLSQLMMVASDDPGVVSEYGKTLAAMGRAQDAVNFLTRAGQLQPTDWTVFSALGVAYDQIGNQKDAQGAYEHALTLKPGEPSVLSNYALSRMLANDPVMARNLAGRAEIANAVAHDTKIAANITLIRSTAPEAPGASYAVNTPAPMPMPSMASPQAAPRMPVASNSMGAPRPLVAPNNGMIEAAPQMAPQMAQNGGVVMQRVPIDPLAGPVFGPAISAAKAPRPLAPKKSVAKAEVKKDEALDMSTARSESPAAMPASATAPGVKSAASQAEDLQARAEALAKQLTNKPAAIAAAQVQANKPEANKPSAPHVLPEKTVAAGTVKAAEAKPAVPAPAPHVLPAKTAAVPTPAKTATAPAPKVVPQPAAKTAAAKPKDSVPALRVSSSAY